MDGWLHTREDEMKDDDEKVSLSDPLVFFLALFLFGKGNSVGSILSFLLWSLVRGWGRLNCEVSLPWDTSDFCGDIEKPWSSWMRDWTSGDSGLNQSGVWWDWAVVVDSSSSRLNTGVPECKREVRGEVEGDLLSEWSIGFGLLAIHSSCPPSNAKNVDALEIAATTSGKTTQSGP